jgi:hypothetical protein
MTNQKLGDLFTPMNHPPIPQEEHWASQMLKKILEEPTNIQTVQIPFPELNIERQTLPFRGNCQGAHSRNPILLIQIITMGRLPLWRPRPGNRRNEQKPAFIQKDQRGAKSFRVFLYAATGAVSNGRSHSLFSVTPGVQVFDNSTPSPRVNAKHDWDGIGSQILSGSLGPLVPASIDRSDTHKTLDRPAKTWLAFLSVGGTALEAARGPLLRPAHRDLFSGRPHTIEKRNSSRPPANGRLPIGWLSPLSKARWRFGAASPGLLGFHGVACPIL